MKLSKPGIERTLRISGILLILGLAVEVFSLLWQKPAAFLVFVGLGGLFTLAGILAYLYSLVPSNSPPQG